jgi:hypothetical protein
MDIPLVGGDLTWTRIDRFLLSLDWEEHFPGVS